MQAPKRKTSTSKRNMRRSHDFISPVMSVNCNACGARKMRHHLCPECGVYRGRNVVQVAAAE